MGARHGNKAKGRPLTGRPVTRHDLVTQHELAEVERLREAARKLAELREDVRDRLLAGAAVEPGPRAARVQVVSRQHLSWAALEDAVGAAEAARVRGLVEPRDVASLYVTAAKAAGRVARRAAPPRTWRHEPEEAEVEVEE